MKIKFKGSIDFVSKGVSFVPGGIYDVSKEVYEYLNKTFGNVEALEVEEKPKAEPKPEPKAEPKVNTKVTPEKK